MGRRKGEGYRKWRLKENPRVECPAWTIDIETLDLLKRYCDVIGKKPSRVVEAAIKMVLINHPTRDKDFVKIFTKK